MLAILTIHLHLPTCSSLKEKRGRIKPLMARLRREFNVSAAEMDLQELMAGSYYRLCDDWKRLSASATIHAICGKMGTCELGRWSSNGRKDRNNLNTKDTKDTK